MHISEDWADGDADDPPEPKHSKAEYDRHKDDLQHLDGDKLIEDAVESSTSSSHYRRRRTVLQRHLAPCWGRAQCDRYNSP